MASHRRRSVGIVLYVQKQTLIMLVTRLGTCCVMTIPHQENPQKQ